MAFDYWQTYEEGGLYHIYNRSSHKVNLFRENRDYKIFLQSYQKYFLAIFDTLAYCLMPNHYHYFVRVKSEDLVRVHFKMNQDSNTIRDYIKNEISLDSVVRDQFRRFHSSYAIRYNKKYKTHGQLFLNRHKSVGVDYNHKFEYLICYIHHNPIHHKFTKKYDSWAFSSYISYMHRVETLVCKNDVLDFFGGIENFKTAHRKFKVLKLLEEEF